MRGGNKLTLKKKSLDFEVKAVNEEENTFEGYASTFGGEPDSYGDVIEKGAFSKTIVENGKRIKILWQHDWMTPIGKAIELHEDNHGLFIKGKVSNTPEGKRAITLMKDGVIDRMSIGYSVLQDEWDREKGIRTLKEIKLFEVSPVTFPANDNAVIQSAKGLDAFTSFYNSVIGEIKAGRVLSDQNKKTILDAVESMKSSIAALEKLVADADGQGDEPNEEEQKQLKSIVDEMKAYAKSMQ